MQCSNRKFIVASISAVVMLGSTNSVLAQDTSPQSPSAQSTSAQGELLHPSAIDERSTLAQLAQQDVASFADDIKSRYGINATVEATSETIPPLPEAIAFSVSRDSTELLPTTIPATSAASTSVQNADSIEDSLDPELQASLQELINSAEALSQDVREQASAQPPSAELAISAPEVLSPAPEFASAPNGEASRQDIAFPSPPELVGQVDSSDESTEPDDILNTGDDEVTDVDAIDETNDLDVLDDFDLDVPETDALGDDLDAVDDEDSLDALDDEGDLDDLDYIDDLDNEDDLDALDDLDDDLDALDDEDELEGEGLGDEDGLDEDEFDADISTDAATLLVPPPEYLNADPNPLFFPTEPEEVEILGNQPITLEQAIALARQNSRELQAALLNFERSQADLRQAQAARFPTLSVASELTHTDTNPAVEPTGPFGNPIDVDNNTTTLNGLVTLDYDLFTSGGRRASIRAAERAVRLQELQVETITEDVRLNVTNAYYDLQETREIIRIAQADLEEALISLSDAEARERAGVGTRFDRLQAEVEVANSQQDLRTAISDEQIARRTLADILSIPSGIGIAAADDVEAAGIWPLTLEQSIVEAFKNRSELEQQLVQRELEQQQRRAQRSQTLPQLSLVGQYSFNDLLDEGNSGSDSESLSVSAQLRWTLFDGGATRAAVRGEEIDAQLAEVEFADTLEAIRLDVETAYSQLGANLENIQTAQIAVDVAEESLRLARLRFQAGVGIQSDVITAQSDLTDAELNLVTAILNYNRALVSIQRAVSNLDGNLTDVP